MFSPELQNFFLMSIKFWTFTKRHFFLNLSERRWLLVQDPDLAEINLNGTDVKHFIAPPSLPWATPLTPPVPMGAAEWPHQHLCYHFCKTLSSVWLQIKLPLLLYFLWNCKSPEREQQTTSMECFLVCLIKRLWKLVLLKKHLFKVWKYF